MSIITLHTSVDAILTKNKTKQTKQANQQTNKQKPWDRSVSLLCIIKEIVSFTRKRVQEVKEFVQICAPSK